MQVIYFRSSKPVPYTLMVNTNDGGTRVYVNYDSPVPTLEEVMEAVGVRQQKPVVQSGTRAQANADSNMQALEVGREVRGAVAAGAVQAGDGVRQTGDRAAEGIVNQGQKGYNKADEVNRIVNGKGNKYPMMVIDGYGEIPFPGGPYKPNNCKTLRPQFTDSYKKLFKEWWINQGRPWPEGEVNIHHIKPLSKGGDNSFENLVPLIQPEEHQPFTNWWRSYPPKKEIRNERIN